MTSGFVRTLLDLGMLAHGSRVGLSDLDANKRMFVVLGPWCFEEEEEGNGKEREMEKIPEFMRIGTPLASHQTPFGS